MTESPRQARAANELRCAFVEETEAKLANKNVKQDVREAMLRNKQLRKLKDEYVKAIEHRVDNRAIAAKEAMTKGSAVAEKGSGVQLMLLQPRKPSGSRADGATTSGEALTYSPQSNYRIGAMGTNKDANLTLHQHLTILREHLKRDADVGPIGLVSDRRPELAFAALGDAVDATSGPLHDLLEIVEAELLRCVYVQDIPRRRHTAEVIADSGSRNGAQSTATTYVEQCRRLEAEFASLRMQLEDVRLEEAMKEAVSAAAQLPGPQTSHKVGEGSVSMVSSGAAASASLTDSLLSEIRELRTELREKKKALREAQAEAQYYGHQVELMQKNLKSSFDRLHEFTTRQRDLSVQGLENLIHESNEELLSILGTKFDAGGNLGERPLSASANSRSPEQGSPQVAILGEVSM